MTAEASRLMAIARVLGEGRCLTTAEITERTGLDRKDVATACGQLVRRDWVDRLERGCFVLSGHGRAALAAGEAIPCGGPLGPLTQKAKRPKRRTIQDKVWSTIRIRKKVDLACLVEMSGGGRDAVRRYVHRLERAGYLAPLRREPGTAPTSNGFKRWILVDDTGPFAPIFKPTTGMFHDPNSGATRLVTDGAP